MIYLERKKTRLSLAVMLTDELSPDKKTLGEVFLSASGTRKTPIKHSTGYFLLLDLPEGKHILTAGGKFYENGTLPIDTKSIDEKKLFVDMPLSPKSNYPFPEGMTILKGRVTDTEGKPISQATISVSTTGPSTSSEDNGEYFIQFQDSGVDEAIDLIIAKDEYRPAEQKVRLIKGKTTKADTTVLIKA